VALAKEVDACPGHGDLVMMLAIWWWCQGDDMQARPKPGL